MFAVLATKLPGLAQATFPLVAIHDSELTRALETMPATNGTPVGPGTTGFQWWLPAWHYFVMPDAVKEALRSDGTAFAVISDASISAGALLDTNGLPKYPILISLAAEAIRDDEIPRLTNYVAAGGMLFVGSSSFTRTTNGVSRGDFAFANELGLHQIRPALTNWTTDNTFTRVSEHQLIAHIPPGTLTWQMPSSSEETCWPEANHVIGPPTGLPHLIWQVRPSGASVLAQGDVWPYLLVRQFGKGWFIYDAAMQPLIGHGGWAPGMHAYGILRNAIQWAFQLSRQPVPKLSPWPYAFDAAVTFRHDMEAISNLIASIESSAQFEFANGARGDYYFCTGELRQDIANPAPIIASLQRAVSNYSATIQPHNGGFTNLNLYIPLLDTNAYDYWHWGPDEVLDLNPSGYANGQAYALASLSNSFNDIQGWIGTNNGGGLRSWVAPYFNATREASYQTEEQLGIQIAGEQKLSPFPHWTVSTQTPDKLYAFLSLPVSDWFLGSQVGQNMESGHTTNSIHAVVDFYYNLGALINLYSHSSSAGNGFVGGLASEYVTYSLSKPKVWSVNAADVYSWWVKRGGVQVVPSYGTNSTQSIITLGVLGSTAASNAVEVFTPNAAYFNLEVRTNGVLAGGSSFRTNGQSIKVQTGTTISSVDIRYSLPPVAQDDLYLTQQGTPLPVAAPGVLTNDLPGTGATNLTAALVNNAAHGNVSLSANGSFTYTPSNNFAGVDRFTYRAGGVQTNSAPATATIVVKPPGHLFLDDFNRATGTVSLTPWVRQLGSWTINNSTLSGTSGSNSYGHAWYNDSTWADYTVQGRIQFSSNNAFAGGIGGRLDPTTGAHYGAWVYPEGSKGGSAVLKLVKFEEWANWSFTPMSQAALPGVGTTPHTLTVLYQGPQITVYYDGVQKLSVTDNSFDSVAPFLGGGISADMFTDVTPFTLTFDQMLVAQAGAPVIMVQPLSQTNIPGATATFTVTALGPALGYQWLKSGSPLAGATASALIITNLDFTDPANYSVIVSNATASVTSSNAALSVMDPIISGLPVSQTNNAGTSAQFNVAANGTSSLSYHWLKNGVALNDGGNVIGSATPNLTLNGVIASDAAGYTVIVSDAAGSITSAPPALLTVVDPFISGQPASRSNNAGTTATFTVTAGGSGTLNYRWFKGGTGALVDGGKISGSGTATLRITSVSDADIAFYNVVVSNASGSVTSSNAALEVVDMPVITSEPVSRTNNAGTTTSFVVNADGTAPLSFHWAKNGLPLSDGGKIFGSSTASLTITNLLGADAAAYTVVINNPAGSTTSAPPAVLTVIDPFLVSQPASRTNALGTPASFSVGAIGTSPSYQWLKNGAPIGNATGASFNIASVTNSDVGNYSVVVSNAFGSVLSSTAALTISGGPPFIQSVTVSNGIVSISWNSVTGRTYRLQFNSTVANSNTWTNVSPDFTATGSLTTVTISINDAPSQFYRVLLLP